MDKYQEHHVNHKQNKNKKSNKHIKKDKFSMKAERMSRLEYINARKQNVDSEIEEGEYPCRLQ